jgi:hypothetical protein
MKGTTTELAVEVAKIIGWQEDEELSEIVGIAIIPHNWQALTPDGVAEVIFSPAGRERVEDWLMVNKQIVSLSWSPGRKYYEIRSYPFSGIPTSSHKGYHPKIEIALALALYKLVHGEKFEVKQCKK